MGRPNSVETDVRVSIAVPDFNRMSEAAGSSGNTPTIFEPQYSGIIEKRDSSNTHPSPKPPPDFSSPSSPVRAPEKKLTLFALRLAVFEKAATGVGALGFIWATVVLLGSFAITLDKTDFWFITIILLIEGTRIFSRSHELEWQHQATWSITDAGINSFRALRSSSHSFLEAIRSAFRPVRAGKSRDISAAGSRCHEGSTRPGLQKRPTRTWITSDVPILPYGQWFFLSRNISKLLYWLQLLSATACVALSLMKLVRHNYGDVAKGDTDKRNRKAALTIFYALALAEALLFLTEKAYWEWKLSYCKLLEEVNKDCELSDADLVSMRRFFYDSYSKCVNGSIFDGLSMDMISFSTELLGSNSPDEQLIGIRILRQFVANQRFSDDTLQKIGTDISVIERLVEMLNWKDPQQEEIRRDSAEILSKLAGKKQNSLRVAGIPGAMESISSLLQTNRSSSGLAADEIGEKTIVFDRQDYGFWTFNHLGLLILKKLARDHDNCGKIGNTRGLLPKIIDFTHIREQMLNDQNVSDTQILTVKRSLQLLKMLASTAGATGKQLRKEISEIVFTIGNIRNILKHGERHPMLQKLGIEILTSLASEDDATERIGGTGGVLRELLKIFFNERIPEDQNHARIAAGEALAMLALESKSNCHRILKLGALPRLVGALELRVLRVNAARILRNLCTYSGDDSFDKLRGVKAAAPIVLKTIIMSEQNKLQEVMIGLASQVFRFMTVRESGQAFEQAGVGEPELAEALVRILRKYQDPHIKVPRIRWFAVELAIWMMRDKAANVKIFESLGLEMELEGILETTSELESFNIFSGTVGLSRHSTTIHALVDTALKLLKNTRPDDEQAATY